MSFKPNQKLLCVESYANSLGAVVKGSIYTFKKYYYRYERTWIDLNEFASNISFDPTLFVPIDEIKTDFTKLHEVVEEKPDVINVPQPEMV